MTTGLTRYQQICLEDKHSVDNPSFRHFRLLFFVQKLIGKYDWRMDF